MNAFENILKKGVAVFGAALLLLAVISAQAQEYDLVILNGRVMDPESGLDAVRNVGVKGGTITTITTEKITGKETIDAKGHVVAPGFIDGHVHITDIPLGQKAMLRDGVTSAMELEGGALPIGRWYKKLEGKSQLNYGASVSASAARTATFDPNYLEKSTSADVIHDMMGSPDVKVTLDTYTRLPDEDQIKNILALVEEGLQQGGLGVGITPGYIVGGYSSQEFIGVQKLAGKYGVFSHVHTRFSSQLPPTTGMLAFQEAIASAGSFGGGLILAHFTAQALNLTPVAIKYIDDLRAFGVPVVLEMYPYNFGASGTGVSADYLKPENYKKNMGRTYSDIILNSTGEKLTKEKYEKLVKSAPFTPVMFYNATEEDMLKGLAHPTVLIGSDAMYFSDKDGKFMSDWDTPWESLTGHPRATGSHARVLRLSREKNLMPLMTTISKMSYQYADFLAKHGVKQMEKKGRIQVGADADITIFDPNTVRDNSSLKKGENALPSTGIPYVVVNGTIVVKDSKVLKGVFPGKPIRRPVKH
jgi:cytosine/adenosine deaminase-related metal-dependent hydrolase